MTPIPTGCGRLDASDVGNVVNLGGWVSHRRDHGGLIFLDLRDATGLVQVVADPGSDAFEAADRSRHEWVLTVTGEVAMRPEGTENTDLLTGAVEVRATRIEVVGEAETPPFVIDDRVEVDEALRLRYRYLDLRRPKMLRHLQDRAAVLTAIRASMADGHLLEVETPTLTRATPEGARDYLVPSRMHPGRVYALAQSPQLYKQLLMVAGVGSYYQIAHCWRDEDLRADRQPEFTQLDLEMSFAGVDEVIKVVEGAVSAAANAIRGQAPSLPFERLTWAESMSRFGTDKPDLRIEGELVELSDVFDASEFKAFAGAIREGGTVIGLRLKGQGAESSRSILDGLVARAQELGAKGLVWMVAQESDIRSPVAKFLSSEELAAIRIRLDLAVGDLALIVADTRKVARQVLGAFRSELGRDAAGGGELDPDDLRWCWVTDFPLVEWNESENRLDPLHHPFCSPHPEDLPTIEAGSEAILEANPEKVRALAYDLVLNGWELGSGSVRIHTRSLQRSVFDAIGIDHEEAEEKFGFLLEAFEYGAPPHAGFAVGLDRLIALLVGEHSIREVIAFPKTQTGSEPMTGAPAEAEPGQLSILGLARKKR